MASITLSCAVGFCYGPAVSRQYLTGLEDLKAVGAFALWLAAKEAGVLFRRAKTE
jgi:hypothetical protein